MENGRYYAGKRKRACRFRISVRAIRTASDKDMKAALSFLTIERQAIWCAANAASGERIEPKRRNGREEDEENDSNAVCILAGMQSVCVPV